MSVTGPDRRPVSGTAMASTVVGLVSLGLAMLNTRPVTEQGFWFTLLLTLLSLALAILTLRGIWRGRVPKENLVPVLIGPGLALFAAFAAQGYRAMQRYDERYMKFANHVKWLTLALQEYEKANGTLPPAALRNKEGQPLLSWRVLVLPVLEREGWAKAWS
jgi:hypothetical protein